MKIPVVPEPGPDLAAFWAERIPGAGSMLWQLAETWPVATARAALADTLRLTASGGTFNTYLLRLRSAVLIAEPEHGQVRIVDALVCRTEPCIKASGTQVRPAGSSTRESAIELVPGLRGTRLPKPNRSSMLACGARVIFVTKPQTSREHESARSSRAPRARAEHHSREGRTPS